MKNKLIYITALMLFLNCNPSGVLAAKKNAQLNTADQKIAALNKKTSTLEKELYKVKSELTAIKQDKSAQISKESVPLTPSPLEDFQMDKLLAATRYAHGLVVVASPLIGIRGEYDTSDLFINLPSLNTDLRLLEQRQALNNYAIEHKEEITNAPLIDLSGSVEAQGMYNDNDYNNMNKSKSDIDLTRAELDAIAEIGPWSTAAMLFSYDNSKLPSTAISAPGARVNSSRVKIDRAFITIGNLNKTPVYFTLGQVYVPFGRYSYVMLSEPLTKTLGQTKARAASLAFSKEGFYGSIYGFRGDAYVTNHNGNTINQGGANLGYKTKPMNGLVTEVGASYIINLADSQGMQNNIFGLSPAMPFYTLENMQHRVPAIDAYLSFDIAPANIGLMGEYVSAMRHFDPFDLSFNHAGAKPAALDVQGVYRFTAGGKKCNIGLGYDQSWQSLGIGLPYGLPKQSYFAAINTSFWKYTIESLEYRHNVAYNHGDVASFKNADLEAIRVPLETTRHQNIVTLQVGVYF